MRTRSWAIFCVVLLATVAGAPACSSSGSADSGGLDDSGGDGGAADSPSRARAVGKDAGDAGSGGSSDAEAGPAGAGGEAGAGGAAGDDSVPSCVPTGPGDLPDDDFADSNCDGIDGDKRVAIFVSPDGKDGNDGSFGSPASTISKGIELAAAKGKDVYVCTAEYAENVVVETTAVNIYGGYDCVTWSRDNQRASVVPASGIALTLRNVTAMTVDRMQFVAADAKDAGASSIAAQIMASDQVVLSHLELTAGNGAPGQSGKAVKGARQAQAGADGEAGTRCNPTLSELPCDFPVPKGGDGPTITCGSTKVHGGTGGRAAPYPKGGPQAGGVGAPGKKKSGAEGANGVSGKEGAISRETFGSVTDDDYVGSNSGGDGTDGTPGESGGGGDGGYSCHYVPAIADEYLISHCVSGDGENYFYSGSGGGQGGYAGCGGAAGHGGGAGGASIALLSIKSTVSLSWSSLTTGTGGRGGAPSDGAKGQAGGRGGKAGKSTESGFSTVTTGQDGGNAGDGGAGGPGGPGGGGPSITLVALGEMPSTQAVTYANGAGGKGAAGFNGRDALSGESGEVKVIQVASSK